MIRKKVFPSKSDKIVFFSILPLVVGVLGLLTLISFTILSQAWISFERFGIDLLISSLWKPSEEPEAELYGLAAPLAGSLYSSFLAIVVSLPVSISLTYLVCEVLPSSVGSLLRIVVEVMGGLPTVVYGLWGSLILAPFLRDSVMVPLYRYLGFIPLFSCNPLTGYSVLTASVVLAIALTPYITSLLIEGYQMIPAKYREGIYGLGATKYEVFRVLLSLLKPYVVAALLLGFSRALGETTIVTLTVGNSMRFSLCLFEPTSTIPSLIANQFESARLYTYALPTLFAGAFLILLISLGVSYVGIRKLYRWREEIRG